jgi:hypothetical protein
MRAIPHILKFPSLSVSVIDEPERERAVLGFLLSELSARFDVRFPHVRFYDGYCPPSRAGAVGLRGEYFRLPVPPGNPSRISDRALMISAI